MKRGVSVLAALLVALSATGCGTLVNQSSPGTYFNAQGQRRPHRLYGGVRTDGEMVADTVARVAHGESVLSSNSVTEHDPATGEWVTRDTTSTSEKVRNAITMTLFLAADFPLSFVADTLLLPCDIYAQWKRLTSEPPAENPKPDELPPTEGSLPLPTKKDTTGNSWQISGRIERPVRNPPTSDKLGGDAPR